jgi:uncharacterized membrane protein
MRQAISFLQRNRTYSMGDHYLVIKFLHLLAFAYWIGADLGVFFAARYAARADLSLDERRRFLALLLLVDMAPRTALILVLPTGVALAALLGLLSVEPWQLLSLWLAAIAWLALAWRLYLRGEARGNRSDIAQRVDLVARGVVIAGCGGLGVAALLGAGPLGAAWLGLKALLYACVVLLGVLLRGVLAEWRAGLQLVAAGGDVAEGNARVAAAARRGERYGLSLWALLVVIAWLGLAKPALA